jgi:signal transduction histidine kinase
VLATDRVQISVPATAVPLPVGTANELVCLVREALHNVERHAGPDARAWVLVEDLGDAVVVSVRDDGAGIPAGRLEAAEAEGRMGIARSIRGRVSDLGGTITLETAPNSGTEWEVRVPR